MSTPKLQAFYKSRPWESLVKQLRIERTGADGLLRCEYCGKPILKAYDCIGHHVEELTDENVDDVMISLNPFNIKLVHFRCHNEIHKRFGFGNGGRYRITQNVYIVYGAPCSGKTTWVSEVAESDDLILDIDRLWGAVRADMCGQYEKPKALTSNVFALRDCMLDMIKVRRGKWRNAYIIGGYPLQGERERLADSVGANKIIFIDTPREICEARAATKSDDWLEYIARWFERYTPPLYE